jgi:hypothetical protein
MRATVFAIAVLAACGDNITGIPFDAYEDLAASARCDRLVRCGLFADRPTCDGYFRKRPDLGLAASINVGKVLFNGVAAEACQAALAAQSCDDSSREVRVPPPACARVFTGTLATGTECQRDQECRSGACDQNAACPANMCCPGTCVASARSDIDGPCATSANCVDDTFCGDDQLCHALSDVGEPCRRDADCNYGLGCINATEQMPGACRETPVIGGNCLYQRCGEIGATCKSFSCVALGLPGAACVSNADCSPFTVCDPDAKVCANLPTLGTPCTGRCAGESYCEATLLECVAPLSDGSPCGGGNECASLFCEEGPVFDACRTPALCF